MERNSSIHQQEIEQRIKAVLSDLLSDASGALDLNASFLELDINSVLAVELVDRLNQELGLALGVEVVFDYRGAQELAAHIVSDLQVSPPVADLAIGQGRVFHNRQEETEALLKAVMAELLELDVHSAELDKSFLDLDINSVLAVELVEAMSLRLGLALGVEVMFDFRGAKELAEFIVSQHPEQVPAEISAAPSDIAIVGISGKFAGSDSVDEFWEHLRAGDSCIGEIKRRGWEESRYFHPDPTHANTSISKWGGLLRDIERFDPRFFTISPLEAERMDPQQRLFLEEAYKAIEDAGYAVEEWSGEKVGVFVGGRSSDYKDRTFEAEEINSQTFLGNDMAILAARISYFLNLKGPSLAIDTACSSSLLALHLASDSIRKGESDIALAGGVFVLSSPEFYVMTSKTNMLSPDGKCKTFDNAANGIVVGEGVGVAVLKRLDAALADGDHIYGVIKGSAVNQDGKTKGITAPSMLSQKNLIHQAYAQAAIDPSTVSYIEAHGTGTKLGDPIEVKALSEAFRQYTDEKQFCALGSHKPNFGHTIMSAGIAGVFKILMAMKHQVLPPTIHVQEVNQHIDFANSPFFLNTELREWKRKEGVPLRAGVSSFGFSGTNCHVVLEEAPRHPRSPNTKKHGYLFPLSAKTAEALAQKITDLGAWLEKHGRDAAAEDVAFTLGRGRSHFTVRGAFVATNLEELRQAVRDVLHSGSSELYVSQDGSHTAAGLSDDAQAQAECARLLAGMTTSDTGDAQEYKHQLHALARLYVKGCSISWSEFYQDGVYRRLSLPTYPFMGESYWVPTEQNSLHMPEQNVQVDAKHPLLHQNTSTLWEQRYTSTFTGQEFFLADHVVKGQRVLPGVAYLEMARAAVELAAGTTEQQSDLRLSLKNVVWARPVVVGDQPVDVQIGLYPEESGDIAFEIYREAKEPEDEEIIYVQGSAVLHAGESRSWLDVQALLNDSKHLLSAGPCYEMFRSIGFEYGPGHQGIVEVHGVGSQMLAKLSLPATVRETAESFILHPSLMDAALQVTITFTQRAEESAAFALKSPLKPVLPFALQELEVLGACTPDMWVLVRYSDGSQAGDRVQKLDLDLCDAAGNVCVKMKGFSTRVLEGEVSAAGAHAASGVLMMHPRWEEKAIAESADSEYAQHVVMLLDPLDRVQDRIASRLPDTRCLTLRSEQSDLASRFADCACQALEEIQRLVADKPSGPVLLQVVVPVQPEQGLFAGLTGLLKTAQLEHPKLIGQLIELEAGEEADGLADKLLANSKSPHNQHIRYQGGMRYVKEWRDMSGTAEAAALPWKNRGVYLITGGLGGLGELFAKEIARSVKGTTLILTGRSALRADKQALLGELEAMGAQAVYKQADVTDEQAVAALIQEIKQTYGTLDGILHAAGIIRDRYLTKKTRDEFMTVLAPKVSGLVQLDRATQDLPLDFFVLFSSIAGSLGNAGQSDYSTANAFMDAYAAYRNARVASGECQGRTLSLNWPLWKEGGMSVDEASAAHLMQTLGMTAMQTASGLRAFYQALASRESQVMVMEGLLVRMKQKLLQSAPPAVAAKTTVAQANASTPGADRSRLLDGVQGALMSAVSKLLKVKIEDLDPDLDLTEYGFDSILFTQFANQLNESYELELAPTIFFEYPTIGSFAGWLADEHPAVLGAKLGVKSASEAVPSFVQHAKNEQALGAEEAVSQALASKSRRRTRFAKADLSAGQAAAAIPAASGPEPVAIIGMSGIFPMANDLAELWDNLVSGQDCISRVPADRWDWQALYGDPKTEANRTNIPWGGFIDGVDEFDSLFFGISPREAELMDPQQRLLMSYAWKAIEDAGYSAQSLSGTRTAIYVGITNSGYATLLSQANVPLESYSSTGWVPSIGPNRLSYFLNLHGPSEPIETSCSSSLVAINRAVQAMEQGICEQAIVGGINTILTPDAHISFNKAGMLCEDGRCKTFSDQANGYVRGEGVGMLFLKKLSAAERDGDHIYGIIRGTAENHGGRAASLTAPNPKAQAELLVDAYTKAGVDPRTVTYIEAHGTGTELGDPIEVNALKTAFKELYQASGDARVQEAHCGLGSIKSNIGHLELAAGVAGVIKVLLQLKHKKLVKSLNCETINPYIHLADSPFYIVRETEDWTALQDNYGLEIPRRAGVSSFGFGGVNAHVVIEEYKPKARQAASDAASAPHPAIIVLSAKSEDRLHEQAKQLLAAVQAQSFTDADLADIAYTLQVGRDAMEERLALIVESIDELKDKLLGFVEDRDSISDLYRGQAKRNKDTVALFALDEDLQAAVASWIAKGKYAKLLDLWVKGMPVDWTQLYGAAVPLRLSLPTYPFAKVRHWVPQLESTQQAMVKFEASPTLSNTLWLRPSWIEQTVSEAAGSDLAAHHVLLIETSDTALSTAIERSMADVRVQRLQAEHSSVGDRYQAYALQAFEEIQHLLSSKPSGQVLLQVVIESKGEQQLFRGLSGLLKTAQLENPKLIGQLIEREEGPDAARLVEQLQENSRDLRALHVRYQDGKRWVAGWREEKAFEGQAKAAIPWKDHGVYLITGGAGGLGLHFAQDIARLVKQPTVILAGRSALSAAKLADLQDLQAGATVEYHAADVTEEREVARLIQAILQQHGRLDGIVHAAGVIKDRLIRNKTADEFLEVLAPKVKGLVHLDNATQHLRNLDFFVLVSSITSSLGNVGQADYAAANAFMDAFAEYRNAKVQAKERCGHTMSLNYPLWSEGGMRINAAAKQIIRQRMGLEELSTATGLQALHQGLASRMSQLMVLSGDMAKLREHVGVNTAKAISGSSVTVALPDPHVLLEQTAEQLRVLFGEATKISVDKIDVQEPLENYGIDSFMITKLNQHLHSIFGEISKTLFYEYQTLWELSRYFAEEHPHACRQWCGLAEQEQEQEQAMLEASAAASSLQEAQPAPKERPAVSYGAQQAVAIIGLSGRYPQARHLDDYWANLKAGKVAITEIPTERWDWKEQGAAGSKSGGRWGAFLDDFDQFDPLFFNMTPREAENMDPQERLFLEEAWKALEDAGYSAARLTPEQRQRTGVFGGMTKQGFQLYETEAPQNFPTTSFASLSNRVSYHLNLQGPSLTIDTMCSSALVALHEACEYIRQGKGDMALAGGVNLYTHPSTYAALARNQLLSDTEQSAAFASGGSGFVPGEGVGVVVLKSYEQAVRDGDGIYAVIRGTAVNHNGKTNGYTVPNPNQQAAVIRAALEQQQIDPRTISYIEAAASGSEMADAIEMTALTKVFGQRERAQGRYKIGSVKPQIGHCEAASGMSQLTKVILSLQNQTLVPTVVAGELNPNINFDSLPFDLQRDVSEWQPVVVDGQTVPRRAGITSIGAGGVNAHLILEEHIPEAADPSLSGSVVFVLSAKSQDRLKELANRWIVHLKQHEAVDIERVAYTLQVGRDEMPYRLALVGSSSEDICQQLANWVEHPEDRRLETERDPHAVALAMQSGDLLSLARLWVLGHAIPWQELHRGKRTRVMNQLPTYPFKRQTCWITRQQPERAKEGAAIQPKEQVYENKAAEFYSLVAEDSAKEFREEYLTFCPFEERVPGFSASRVFLNPDQYPMERQMMRAKQIELRQVLFCKEDFANMRTLLDIGCGHGTDVIQIASLYPHIKTHGYTITAAQSDLGNQRIASMGLSSRAQIFHRDSSKDPFPDRYDTVIGIEVSFHIRDKQGLFHNISSALKENGSVLLMDYIANLRGAIVDPKVEISIPTQQEWVELLSAHQLVIEVIIDVSPQVANFLYDPEVEKVTKDMPQVVKDTYQNYANQSISLEKGWISYCLIKLKKDSQRSETALRAENARQIANKTPYAQAVAEMLRGHVPYPKSEQAVLQLVAPQEMPQDNLLAVDADLQAARVRDGLAEVFMQVLGLSREDLVEIETFQELGIGSINAVELVEAINARYDLHLPTSVVFECNTLDLLAKYVGQQLPLQQAEVISFQAPTLSTAADSQAEPLRQVVPCPSVQPNADTIAIIGLSVRSAAANGQSEFWELIRQGRDGIQEIRKDSWRAFLESNSEKRVPTRYGAMEDIESFDSTFFKISPKEAEAMDASQRVLLEECYKALEDAGYDPTALREQQVGTFIGSMATTTPKQDFSHFAMLGADTSILSARIAYYLNLKGPALTINTACSSSLVAIDIAAQKLKSGEIDLAIAGGITIYTHPEMFISMNNAGMLSPTGECRPFDDRANGIVVGDGVGLVILKRLSEAERDGDFIYGVIRGSGINQDGQTSGITVPSFQSQSRLQESVYKRNGIDVEDIQYIEAHGTATKLGDPIEIHALTDSFRKFTAKKRFAAIGSLKANIGHTTAAAGVLGLIKVLLSLKHKQLPPLIHYQTENQHIDFANSPVYVNTELRDWPLNKKGSRLAAINSFGFSGTNAHLVIEEHRSNSRKQTEPIDETASALLVLSAETEEGLRLYARQTQQYLLDNPQVPLDDILYTLLTGRASLPHRLALVSESKAKLIEQLAQFAEGQQSQTVDCYVGKVRRHDGMKIGDTEEGREFIRKLAQNKKIRKLAELWVSGNQMQWEALYPADTVQRVPGLPHYPFAKTRYPIAEPAQPNASAKDNPQVAEKQPAPVQPTSVQPVFAPPVEVVPSTGEGLNKAQRPLVLQPTVAIAPVPLAVSTKPTGISLSALPVEPLPARNAVNFVAVDRLQVELAVSLAEALYMSQDDIDLDEKFVDLGLDSIIGVEWMQWINRQYGTSLPATKVYEYPTIRLLAEYLSKQLSGSPAPAPVRRVLATAVEVSAAMEIPAAINTRAAAVHLQEELAASLAEALYMSQDDVDVDQKFVDMGLDSIIGVEWVQGINKQYGTAIAATKVYDYPTIRLFAAFLEQELKKQQPATLSLDEIMQQVYQGKLDAGHATQLLQNISIKGGHQR